MGDAQRRKHAGDMQPKQGWKKSRKMTRKEKRDLALELTVYGNMAALYRQGMAKLAKQGGKGE